jgi:hypothetical protein
LLLPLCDFCWLLPSLLRVLSVDRTEIPLHWTILDEITMDPSFASAVVYLP